ncbi:MAG TPA: sulfotransferase [Gammaproteobacteria bacterium]|nr:sulfotransferase [Gammaproteobacteria bacterium]
MGKLSEHLIFIISQPRSGSTLLQHILGNHSQVHTLPEPWFMLNLVYGFRSSGLEAEYNAQYAYLALKDFLGRIPEGEATYWKAARSMALSLYKQALEPSGKKYFLDKTPRYYFIIPELYHLFPEAKFVILLRNPLAVLSSIIEVNFGGDWRALLQKDRKHDILTAPGLILNGIRQLGEKAAVVHYEQLVTEPEQTVRNLCQQLGLQFETEMLNYGGKVKFEGTTFVDPKSIYKHQHPVGNYLGKWVTRLDTPQKFYIAKTYLTFVRKDPSESLGYCYDDLINKLNSLTLKKSRNPYCVPWRLIVTPIEELSWSDRFKLKFFIWLQLLQHRGIWAALRHCANFALKKR